MVVDEERDEVALLPEVLPVLRPRRHVVGDEHRSPGQEPHVGRLLDDQVGGGADPDVDHHVRLPALDLEQLRSQVHHRAVEHDGLELGPRHHRREELLGVLHQAHAVVGVLGQQRDLLEALLLDPAVPQLHPVGVDDVGAEAVVEVLLGEGPRRGLGGEDRHLELLGEVLHRQRHRAVELTDHRHHPVLGRELAEAGRALLGRARVVLHHQLHLAPAQDALGVDLVGAHLGSAQDQLARGGVPRRRQRRQHADLHRLLGEGRSGRERQGEESQPDYGQPSAHASNLRGREWVWTTGESSRIVCGGGRARQVPAPARNRSSSVASAGGK